MSRARILILADSGLAAALAAGLGGHGFRVETTAARDAALALAAALGFDAAVVDRDSLGARPAASLAALAAILRGPICLLTPSATRAKPAPTTAILLPKPVRLQTLAAALRAALAAKPALSGKRAKPTAGLDFDPVGRRLRNSRTGAETALTETETQLLSMLQRTQGQAVAREDLLRAVWGYNPKVSTRTLETHIYRLRQKLALGQGRAAILETVPGGYRLASRGKEVRK